MDTIAIAKQQGLVYENDIPWDYVQFPSKGILYQHQKEGTRIQFLVGSDESILSSRAFKDNVDTLFYLVNKKIMDKEVKAEELLIGDFLTILLNLRITGFGQYLDTYVVLEDGSIEMRKVDLTKLKSKPFKKQPNENMCFTFETPMLKRKVEYKLISWYETIALSKMNQKMAEERRKSNPDYIQYEDKSFLQKLQRCIVAIENEKHEMVSNVAGIESILNRLPLGEIRAIADEINDVEAGIDLNYEDVDENGRKFFREIKLTDITGKLFK